MKRSSLRVMMMGMAAMGMSVPSVPCDPPQLVKTTDTPEYNAERLRKAQEKRDRKRKK